MANEMVERVRRVICGRSCGDGTCHYRTTVCEPLARAAIAAMREPTKEMFLALRLNNWPKDWERGKLYQREHGFDLVNPNCEDEVLMGHWQMMVDEALRE